MGINDSVTCRPTMRQGTTLAKHKPSPLALLTHTESIPNLGRFNDMNGKGPRRCCITRAVLVGMKNVSHYKLGSGAVA